MSIITSGYGEGSCPTSIILQGYGQRCVVIIPEKPLPEPLIWGFCPSCENLLFKSDIYTILEAFGEYKEVRCKRCYHLLGRIESELS